jgi:hypothetical protein
MSLKSKYKTDVSAAREGVWVEFEANSDGTVPAFRLARMSNHNRKFALAFREAVKKYAQGDGATDFGGLDEDTDTRISQDLFFETVLVDWRNFQPEDDGVAIEYSPQAARDILGEPDWSDLFVELNLKARDAANYRHKTLQAEAKN